jgi:hypothetical protein
MYVIYAMCVVEIGFHIDYYIKLWLVHLTKINVVLVQPIFADFKPFCSTFFFLCHMLHRVAAFYRINIQYATLLFMHLSILSVYICTYCSCYLDLSFS